MSSVFSSDFGSSIEEISLLFSNRVREWRGCEESGSQLSRHMCTQSILVNGRFG